MIKIEVDGFNDDNLKVSLVNTSKASMEFEYCLVVGITQLLYSCTNNIESFMKSCQAVSDCLSDAKMINTFLRMAQDSGVSQSGDSK